MADERRIYETSITRHSERSSSEVHQIQKALRVYLAHNFSAASHLKTVVVPKLHERNIIVCSSWIYQEAEPGNEQYWAIRCLEEVTRCDLLVIFQEQFGETPGRGKYVEFGYALARNKPIMVIGEKIDCIFYYYPQIMRVKDFKEALEIMSLR